MGRKKKIDNQIPEYVVEESPLPGSEHESIRDEGGKVIITLLVVVIFCLVLIIGFLFYREFDGNFLTPKETPVTKQVDTSSVVHDTNGASNQQFVYTTYTAIDYTFKAPEGWLHTGQRDLMDNGCLWDSLSKGGDGLRMGGEIGIYPVSCFNIAFATGKREFIEKDGFYIIAFYDRKTGTTLVEEFETQAAFKKIVETFVLK